MEVRDIWFSVQMFLVAATNGDGSRSLEDGIGDYRGKGKGKEAFDEKTACACEP